MRRHAAASRSAIALGAGRVLGMLLLSGSTLFCVAGCGAPDRPPHLILVSVDTLRPDHLSLNGYARATSPNIDEFAAQALHFTDAITPIPKTGPSFTTMFSGRPPGEHGVDQNPLVIPAGIPLLAEELAAAGYQTGAFVSNPVLTEAKGYARGFSKYLLEPDAGGVERVNDGFFAWEDTVDWDRPVFAWIHYMDPHGPYTPPAPFDELFVDDAIARADPRRVPLDYEPLSGFSPSYVLGAVPDYQRLGDEDRAARYIALYDAEIRYMDAAFGKLLASLRERGVLDDAVIVLLADHGESLGEHDYWFEHGWFPFDDVLRTPFLLKPPRSTSGRSIPGVVTTLDLMPTLLGFAGRAQPPGGLPGHDLMKSTPGEDPVIVLNSANYPGRYLGLRTPAWKYLRRLRMSGPPIAPFPPEQLYDLRADPAEANDLSGEEPERVAALRAELDRQLQELGPRAATQAAPVVGPALREKLRALGYTE